jgi:hypothetical protein
MGRETSSLHLLASLLLTGGKGADLVIRGNVVLNTLSARSTSTLLRDQICINSSSNRQVTGLAELSYATVFNLPSTQTRYVFLSRMDLLFFIHSSKKIKEKWYEIYCGEKKLARPTRFAAGSAAVLAVPGQLLR